MRSAPYGTLRAQEGLEGVLMASAFEQQLTLLLVDDGVFQLMAGQDPAATGSKNFSPAYRALEMYGVEQVVVERESLAARGLSEADLLIPVVVLDSEHVARVLDSADVVMSF